MPPGAAVAQHGVAIVQSIMQLSGQAQHGATLKHGFMHGSMTFIGQSTMAAAFCSSGKSGMLQALQGGRMQPVVADEFADNFSNEFCCCMHAHVPYRRFTRHDASMLSVEKLSFENHALC